MCVTYHIQSTNAALDMSVSDLYVHYDSFMCVTWLSHMCDMTHLYVSHDSFLRVIYHIQSTNAALDMSVSELYVIHNSFMCATWLIHTCDMTNPCVWHDSFIHVTYHIQSTNAALDMSVSELYWRAIEKESLANGLNLRCPRRPLGNDVSHNSFIHVTWLTHICDMTQRSLYTLFTPTVEQWCKFCL